MSERHLVDLGGLKQLAEMTNAKILSTDTYNIKYVNAENNVLKFYRDYDAEDGVTGVQPAFTIDFPSEIFLDGLNTTFEPNFTWSNVIYPGSTNPNVAAIGIEGDPDYVAPVVYDGKPVLVLAIKTQPANNVATTTEYHFIKLDSLVDIYTPAAGDSSKILTIAGYTVTVHISAVANNAITVQNDGLHVDISGKTDKVTVKNPIPSNPYDENEEAQDYADFNTNYSMDNSIALLTTDGNIKDSGLKVATSAEVSALLNSIFNPA